MVVEPWLRRAAASRGARPALQTPEGSCTYTQLLARALAGEAELVRRGATPGTRVAIALSPGMAFAEALHACLLLGAVAVPVDLRLASAERERIIADSDLLVSERLCGALARERPVVKGHDLGATAVVIHSSGTTSEPRPVQLSYGNLLWSALGSGVALGVDPDERWLCALPLSHVGGLSILVRSVIYATTAVVHERFQLERVLAVLNDGEISLVSLVATTLARLLDAGLRSAPSLRCALTGGGPLPGELLERAQGAGIPVAQTYGLTEAASQVTTVPAGALGVDWDGAAGPPLFCTRVQIAADGEILVAGPTVSRECLGPDGWLHTGDLGSLDGSRGLRVLGRKLDTIVTGGENVAPAEVEAVLEQHPDVLEAAVIGKPDPNWGEAIVALIVTRQDGTLDRESLRAHCARQLAGYKIPKEFIRAHAPLPRTRSGKLLRRKLR
jgi:o-succinylbenzoate---CoA ligase